MHFVTNLFPAMGVKNLSKSLRFARVTDESLLPRFLMPHSVYNTKNMPTIKPLKICLI